MANSSSNTRRWMEEAPRPREPRDDRRSQEERYWRQREDEQKRQKEAERRAKEEAEKKALDIRNEVAYPTLGGGPRPKTSGLGKNQFAVLNDDKPKPTSVYASLAKNWKKEDEETRERERLRRLQSERDRFSSEGIFVYRPRQVQSGYGGYPEDDEPRRTKPSDDEWQEISHKAYRPKREKTVEELDDEYQRDLEDEENEERSHNEHLFEVSHRHDHH